MRKQIHQNKYSVLSLILLIPICLLLCFNMGLAFDYKEQEVNNQKQIIEELSDFADFVTMNEFCVVTANSETKEIIHLSEDSEKILEWDDDFLLGQNLNIIIPKDYRAIHKNAVRNRIKSNSNGLSFFCFNDEQALNQNGELINLDGRMYYDPSKKLLKGFFSKHSVN